MSVPVPAPLPTDWGVARETGAWSGRLQGGPRDALFQVLAGELAGRGAVDRELVAKGWVCVAEGDDRLAGPVEGRGQFEGDGVFGDLAIGDVEGR